jgi:peptidylprolyl isomerase
MFTLPNSILWLFTLMMSVMIPFQTFAEEPKMTTAKSDENKAEPIFVIETDQGDIKVRLLCDVAPKTCENFIHLAETDYYKDVIFHRVIKNFMIQGGDPTGTGRGGQSKWGKPFADEFSPKWAFDEPGLLAMANAGPGTNGSQFFITTVATPWLNNKHTIFGVVTSGYANVQKIENLPTDAQGRPANPPKIKRIYRAS